jgi:hypothetical protein
VSKETFVCREAPYGDFCNISPNSHGGIVAWGKTSEPPHVAAIEDIEIECRSGGRFMRGDMYCDGDYVWRCRNDENCNLVYPL